jgi:hypothetical protein
MIPEHYRGQSTVSRGKVCNGGRNIYVPAISVKRCGVDERSEQRDACTHGSRCLKRYLVTDLVRMQQISKDEARGMG